MKKLHSLGFVAVISFVCLTNHSHAQVWAEVGDAGQTPTTYQGTGLANGNPLNTILGSIGTSGDVDLYAITINTPSAFSATTVNALTGASGLDTELYLLDNNFKPVYANDDDSGGLSLQSTLPAGNVNGPLAAGFYYLAISTSGNEPINFANQELFTADSPSNTIRTPNPANVAGLAGWDSSQADPGIGLYEIDLTGALTAVPEISPKINFALQAFAGVLVFAWIKRRRLQRP